MIEQEQEKLTPMMQQWHACKKHAGTAILLFRMGDFYELFHNDAVVASKELNLTLTKRQEVPMAGVPVHTCEAYIDKLIKKGFCVALAEQTQDPKETKGIVNREVVRIFSPGSLLTSSLIAEDTNNYFASVTQVGGMIGLAFLDLTTGEFRTIELQEERQLLSELYRLRPAEILTSKRFRQKYESLFQEISLSYNIMFTVLEDWKFDHQLTYNTLVEHLKVKTLDGFGLKGMVASTDACGALVAHMRDTLCQTLDHITELQTYAIGEFMVLDMMTQRNLELTDPLYEGGKKATLLGVLDQTATSMGARLLRRWIKQPLLDVAAIEARQDAIAAFFNAPEVLEDLQKSLDQVSDMERLMSRIASGYGSPRDLVALGSSLRALPQVKQLIATLRAPLIMDIERELNPLPEVTGLIAAAIVDEPPLRASDGQVIRAGYHAQLDELRTLSADSKTWIANYQAELRDTLGIKTLKVGFNRMFGYFIEVSRQQAERMPDTFQRRQTLVNGERYISPELKDYESKVLTAEDQISRIEAELFLAIRTEVATFSPQINRMGQHLAALDVLASLASVAIKNRYTRPDVDKSEVLVIKEGRHPVVESVHVKEPFISNDTFLDGNDQRMYLITGPNMAGKSTFIRQVALITIMAQMGSFVPASYAHIGIVDKVFTRIGASDDLSRGQSTFMVEMTETANILNNVTKRSLVILDEIGRGTSTYDGISIAWAVAEYLLTAENKMPKTLFATHYWELTKLEGKIPGAVNYNVAVSETPEGIIFLRKIIRGGTDKSYGIHVAKLAGLPSWVIQRSLELLSHLEENANRDSAFEPTKAKKPPKTKTSMQQESSQLSLFS